jgi:TolB protein
MFVGREAHRHFRGKRRDSTMATARHISRTTALSLLTGVLSISGCTQYYTGGMGVEDRKSVAQYQQFRQEQRQQLAPAPGSATAPGSAAATSPTSVSRGGRANIPAERAQNQIAFTDAMPASAAAEDDPIAAALEPVSAKTMQGYSQNATTDKFTALQLYGHLPMDPTQQVGSPMDAGDTVRRVSFTTEGNDFDPDVDPSGQWLVYASTRHRETSDLYLKRIDGTAVTQLTADPANEVMPKFSPDGRRVAFASDKAGNWDIYIIDVEGGQPVQITNSPAHELHPSWSPDGRRLVYSTLGHQSGQWELVVVDVDNPATKRFVGYGLFPHWSPVDNRIVFQRARERGTRWFSVWTIELDDAGEARRPTEIAAATNAACITPAWSPDGKHVAFCTVVNPGTSDFSKPSQADVWIVSADGRHRANLTQSRFANLQPVWGPDGSVFFVSDRAKLGVENVWALRPDHVLRVAQPQGQSTTPSAQVPTP